MTLYRKYRPQKFADLVGQDHIRDTLIQAAKEGKISQAYLFTGPRGTGKTTTARLISKVVNCLEIDKQRAAGKETDGEPCGKCQSCLEILESRSLDIIEIDAASNRSIDDIRELREQIRFAPAKSKFKVYIIDEVHMLTREAFNALLKTLEEPPKHAIFILATTEPHKVLPTIISRTQRFDFRRIDINSLSHNLQNIAEQEGLKSDKEALEMISVLADGGGRDSLSLLEQVAAYSSDITAQNVRTILGIAEIGEIAKLIGAIFNSDAEEGLKIAHTLFQAGNNLVQLNASIVDVLRKVLTYSISGTYYYAETSENKKIVSSLCKSLQNQYGDRTSSRLLQIVKCFIDAGKMIKETVDPLVAIEVAIVESVDSTKPKVHSLEPKAAVEDTPIKGANSEEADDKRHKPTTQSSPVQPLAPSGVKEGEAPGDDLNPVGETADLEKTTQPKPATDQTKLEEVLGVPSASADKKEEEKHPRSANGKPEGEDAADDNLLSNNDPLTELPEEIWSNIIAEVKKDNTPLAALLRDAKPMAIAAGKLVLGVRFKFHKDKISETKNIQVLEGIICNVTGNSCRVQCEIADFSASKKKDSHSDEELASEAEKVFGE